MAYVPGFGSDIFISYSHIDDQAVDPPGWVSGFHRRLQIEVEEELGARVKIWRDPRIGPADDFSRDIDRQVRGSAMLLAILSPGYLNSSWCEWELTGFAGSRRTGDLWVGTKCRVIKIFKRPAPASAHRLRVLSEIGSLEFFETDDASGLTYEMEPGSATFNKRLTILAKEIGLVLGAMRKARSVFLGSASAPLLEQRERLKQELDAREYRILEPPAESAGDARAIVRAAVQETSLSILFYDLVGQPSQNPADALAADEREVAREEGARQVVVVRGRPDGASQPWHEPGSPNVEWMIEPPAHTLYHTVLQMLGAPADPAPPDPVVPPPSSTPAQAGRPQRMVRVYLICDRPDHPLLLPNRARHLRDHLLGLGFEVKVPLAEDGDAAEFSRDNRNKLRQCDGVLLYWGTARQGWFDQRLGELMQARGWRRGRDFAAVGAYVADPQSPVKENYETREVDELIKQFQALDVSDVKFVRFVERLGQPV